MTNAICFIGFQCVWIVINVVWYLWQSLYCIKHQPSTGTQPVPHVPRSQRTFSLTYLLYTCAYFQFWFLRSCIINSPIWCRNTTIVWQTPPPKRWKIGTTLTGKQQEFPLPHIVTPTHIHTPPHLYLSNYPSPLTKRLHVPNIQSCLRLELYEYIHRSVLLKLCYRLSSRHN